MIINKQINQHWIQEAYIRAWKKHGSPIYEFSNTNLSVYKEKNVNKILSCDKYYSVTLNDPFILHLLTFPKFSPEYEKVCIDTFYDKDLRDLIKEYTITYNGDFLKEDIFLFSLSFKYFENWSIKKDSLEISIDDRKSLKEKLDNWHCVTIENKFSIVEITWRVIRNFSQLLIKKPEEIEKSFSIFKEALIKYLFVQKIRTENGREIIDNAISSLNKEYTTCFSRDMWLGKLNQVLSELECKSGVYYECVERIMEHKIEFLIAPDGYEFITSDNPVFSNTNQENLTKGLHFPLTPNVLVILRKRDDFEYTITYINEVCLKNINSLIIKNSINYIYSGRNNISALCI